MPDETGDESIVTEPEIDAIPLIDDDWDDNGAFDSPLPPSASSPAPPDPGTSGSDGESGAVDDPVARLELDPRHRDDFNGLLYLGDLSHSFSMFGHQFSIRTLRIDEMLKVSLLVKAWEGTLGHNRAYLTAMAAACCEQVDGRPLYSPLGPSDDLIAGRFKYVCDHWFPWVVDGVYERFLELESRVSEILDAMGEAGG